MSNMREIEFRAWEIQTTDEYGYTYGGIMHYSNQEHSKRRFEIAGFDLDSGFNEDDFILMQYTGLKDKNGKKIYEGDIISSDAWEPRTYEVGFREGAFCFYRDESIYANNPEYMADFEVIGNIYENPEMLENK